MSEQKEEKKQTILVRIKWNIVRTMMWMLKTPLNLTVPLRTYRKRLIKELVHFSWSITKTVYISMEHSKYGVFGATEGGMSHFFTSGSEVRDHHNFLGSRKHYGATRANVSKQKSNAECLWVFFFSGSAGHAWDRVFSTLESFIHMMVTR